MKDTPEEEEEEEEGDSEKEERGRAIARKEGALSKRGTRKRRKKKQSLRAEHRGNKCMYMYALYVRKKTPLGCYPSKTRNIRCNNSSQYLCEVK